MERTYSSEEVADILSRDLPNYEATESCAVGEGGMVYVRNRITGKFSMAIIQDSRAHMYGMQG